jgi:CDP-diacylglycerol--serine O-phosphatidyltransferase
MNLLSGVGGIVAALNGFWNVAFWLMIAGAGFDFFDGMVARLLKVSGELGKQLDSLSDLITFGVLPSIMMYKLLLESNLPYPYFTIFDVRVIPLLAFLIAAFSSLRLAKFNIDERQTSSFIGLPTPANALFIGALSYATHSICHCNPLHTIIASPFFLIPLVFLSSYILVAELPLFALKFKNLKWNDNKVRYIFIILSITLLIVFYQWSYMAIIIIIPMYIIMSIINNKFKLE